MLYLQYRVLYAYWQAYIFDKFSITLSIYVFSRVQTVVSFPNKEGDQRPKVRMKCNVYAKSMFLRKIELHNYVAGSTTVRVNQSSALALSALLLNTGRLQQVPNQFLKLKGPSSIKVLQKINTVTNCICSINSTLPSELMGETGVLKKITDDTMTTTRFRQFPTACVTGDTIPSIIYET